MDASAAVKAKWNAAPIAGKGKYFEYVIQALIDAFCRPGDCAVDIGANWGSHSWVMLEAAGPRGEVIAVEPDPALAAHLETWTARHPNLHVLRVALSDHSGMAEFFRAQETGYNTLNAEVSQRTQAKDRISVPVRRLDELSEFAARSPSLVKIDVEGEELRVLFGAEAMLKRCRPLVIAEVDWRFLFRGDGKPSEHVLFNWLAGLCPGGYAMFDLFGQPVTQFEWDAWNVAMLPAGSQDADALRTVCIEAGLRYFEIEAGWDPMMRFRKAHGKP